MLSRDRDSVRGAHDRLRAARPDHPLLRLAGAIDPKLQRAATPDPAEQRARKLLIVFELQPVNEAVVGLAAAMQQFQQRLAVRGLEAIWSEPRGEGSVMDIELGVGEQLAGGA